LKQTLNTWLSNTAAYMRKDYNEWPLRFCLEIFAWIGSVGCALGMTLTIPTPPLLQLYTIWVASTAVYAWAAWTRGSFGMLGNYALLFCIDIVGLLKLVADAVK
jgi:hypothetical protein